MDNLDESSTTALSTGARRRQEARRLSGTFRPAGGVSKEEQRTKFGFVKVGEDEYFVLPSECSGYVLPEEGLKVSFEPWVDGKSRKRARSVREAGKDVVVLSSSSEEEDDHSKAREDPYEKPPSSGEEEKVKTRKRVQSWPLTQNVLERVAEVTCHPVETVREIADALQLAQEEKEATLAWQKVLEEQEKEALAELENDTEEEKEEDGSPMYVKPVSKKKPRP